MSTYELGLYTDAEVKAGIEELFSNAQFVSGMKAFLPDPLFSYYMEVWPSLENCHEFQTKIIYPLLKGIKSHSISHFESQGLERLDPNESYLFISNHRDIGLDSAFINLLLHESGFPTAQIAIGDNLLQHRIAELIFRINKSFAVKRSGNPRELYQHSKNMSAYISNQVNSNTSSVWIAQREGRAKDGNDETQLGILKMLALAKDHDTLDFINKLKIVPVSISYGINPCDLLMASEFIQKQKDPNFSKSFKEDMRSVLAGLKGDKGKVNVHFAELIQLEPKGLNDKEVMLELKEKIDRSIQSNYYLSDSNHAAYQKLYGSPDDNNQITICAVEEALARIDNLVSSLDPADQALGKQYLLSSYAAPVANKLKWTSKAIRIQH